MIENVHISSLGPPGPSENDFFMAGVVMFGIEMLGLANFDQKNVMFGSSNRLKYTFSLLGPPGPTDDDCLLVLVVIFGLEMLNLVNFDNENC